jgi:hypothetical protein
MKVYLSGKRENETKIRALFPTSPHANPYSMTPLALCLQHHLVEVIRSGPAQDIHPSSL